MIAILVLRLFAGAALLVHGAMIDDPGLLGLKLGMPASEALRAAGKDPHALDRIKLRSGQRVISDTISITFCKLAMRRSLGFDESGKLTAVGFTYKTSPEAVRDARDCAYQWLSNLYGPPADETIHEGSKQEIWKLGTARITLEAKGYNPEDYFVLIYYYRPQQNQSE